MANKNDVKVSAQKESASVIRLEMVFNTKSSDGADVNYVAEAFVPVANQAADDKMCKALETAIEPFSKDLKGMFAYVSSIRTGAQLMEMDKNPGSHPPTAREMAEISARMANLQDGISDMLDRVMNVMGKNFVNKTNINFETKCTVAP